MGVQFKVEVHIYCMICCSSSAVSLVLTIDLQTLANSCGFQPKAVAKWLYNYSFIVGLIDTYAVNATITSLNMRIVSCNSTFMMYVCVFVSCVMESVCLIRFPL